MDKMSNEFRGNVGICTYSLGNRIACFQKCETICYMYLHNNTQVNDGTLNAHGYCLVMNPNDTLLSVFAIDVPIVHGPVMQF